MTPRIIDLSHDLNPSTPVFPNYPPVEIAVLDSTADSTPIERHLNSSRMAIGLHCGTHMDAPFHFIETGRAMDQVSLNQCVGPALLLVLSKACKGSSIEPRDLMPHQSKLREVRKVILNTGWHRRWGDPIYFLDHPIMTRETAQFLVDCGVHLVGVDMPSVDRPPFDAHLILLGNDAVILENLTNLDAIRSEFFQLITLPLKISGGDACPIRAVAMEI